VLPTFLEAFLDFRRQAFTSRFSGLRKPGEVVRPLTRAVCYGLHTTPVDQARQRFLVAYHPNPGTPTHPADSGGHPALQATPASSSPLSSLARRLSRLCSHEHPRSVGPALSYHEVSAPRPTRSAGYPCVFASQCAGLFADRCVSGYAFSLAVNSAFDGWILAQPGFLSTPPKTAGKIAQTLMPVQLALPQEESSSRCSHPVHSEAGFS
jgi:hypothetical protein